MLLKLMLNDGTTHELQVKNLLEVDGVTYDGLLQADPSNHEDRIRMLERLTTNMANFLDEKFQLVATSPQKEIEPSPQKEIED